MMKIINISLLLVLLASGCSAAGGNESSAAVGALTAYLQAFADKNEARMSSLVCKDWSTDAMLEYDAFQGVKTRLDIRASFLSAKA